MITSLSGALSCWKKSKPWSVPYCSQPSFFVLVKLEKELLFMAPVGDVPNTAGDIMSVGAGHKELVLFS